ncbi:hypothetical protein ACKZDW_15330 [Ralstonia syzygii subsp. celebesensis]|uniref:Uncharacterized protein n=2 Tax=Ralstonia syzygii subsp. celebesensis TaxID=1310168 RepID=A0A1U9VIS5_9RALS|nr:MULTISPECIES: hypothetical protein [Ralstonia solanacearum species complex]AQW29971.1 hypothetical protein B0B51_08250 [blood disease bacterium A2-HR MARDI]QQV56191.1 hypothetical protein JK151_03905 [Ralstonia syzygii subsp. celebesensis]CBJ52473.1 conserved exported protein of unknown function [Ralstonia solanacearum PSI07]CCA80435.1 conserved exported hypothetical protein [blood disease bacterium R229]
MNKLLLSLSAIAIAAASAYANAQTPSADAGASLQTNGAAAVAPAQGSAGLGLKAGTGAKVNTEAVKSQLSDKTEQGAKAVHEHKAHGEKLTHKATEKAGHAVKSAKTEVTGGASADANVSGGATTTLTK